LGLGVEAFINGASSLRVGETVDIVTPGAGGYGPAAERDPATVERNLADGRIDPLTLAAIYCDQAGSDTRPTLPLPVNPSV